MIIKRKLRLAMQSAATTLTFALAAVGSVGATTTIGTNISTDGSLTVATTSTLQGAVGITSTSNPQLSVKYDTANYWTEGVGTTGRVTMTRYGSELQKGFTLADTVAIATSSLQTLLTVDSTNSSNASTTLAVYTNGTGNAAIFIGGNVGVASSTPWGLLAVEQSTESKSFLVMNSGSTTPSFIINGVNGNGRVGVGTSSPYALFSIGMDIPASGIATTTPMFAIGYTNGSANVSGNGTTTIDLGKVCFRSLTSQNTVVYWSWKIDGTGFSIASSSASCY